MNRSTGQVSYRSGTFWERTERVSSDGEQQRISRETVLLEEREREGGRERERERANSFGQRTIIKRTKLLLIQSTRMHRL